ncbi:MULTISPECIES: hypothetical protein [unclassified Corynebacterium]|uniref:hypothetical protein n=1 Tax=unclassified Corynebacterium TaxID=2624378 RepID=UPI001EF3AC45|nr:hypothetical protein [Corynebacterium sp. ACRPH]MCG7456758.1 hypothetical protein [Corynebacterium sp. ACRPH]
MPNPSSPSVAFDQTVLTDVQNGMRPSKAAQFVISLIFGLMMFILCAPITGPLPALGILVAAVLAGVVWWRYLRRGGVRGNDYSPMKSDAEAARTPFSWKEEGRLVLVLALVFGISQVASMFSSQGRWGFAAIAALITVGLMYWVVTLDAWRPTRYTDPEKLGREMRIEDPTEWLQAFLYCRRCVPGGLQILSDTLKEDLSRYGWTTRSANEALDKLVEQGKAVKIRELRSTDGARKWVTLTKEGSQDFQERHGG